MTQPADSAYMQRAVELAYRAQAATRTNPLVGAVLVHAGRIISEGYHTAYGAPHAEVEALKPVPHDPDLLARCTLYVTLEPCTHHGKTPPCVDLIIERGLKQVVVGQVDPNPVVCGIGLRRLQESGIYVKLLQDEASARLLQPFATQQLAQRPWIHLKWAQTHTGILGRVGERLLITGPAAQVYTHRLRAKHQAILIGAGTLQADQPRLSTRQYPGADPEVFVLQRAGKLGPHHLEAPVWVVNASRDGQADGVHYLRAAWGDQGADLGGLMRQLYQLGVGTLLVEGGSRVLRSFLSAGLFDEISVLTSNDVSLNELTLNVHASESPCWIEAPRAPVVLRQEMQLGPDTLWYYRRPTAPAGGAGKPD
ncbi:MAG: bifunctional diaminohydroxyphosphoribosylaminopyrimidine deaminase/5-amino-6-(5-phosphoribosylamino)uracil reductase RibD [Sphingobacteriia bacterium]